MAWSSEESPRYWRIWQKKFYYYVKMLQCNGEGSSAGAETVLNSKTLKQVVKFHYLSVDLAATWSTGVGVSHLDVGYMGLGALFYNMVVFLWTIYKLFCSDWTALLCEIFLVKVLPGMAQCDIFVILTFMTLICFSVIIITIIILEGRFHTARVSLLSSGCSSPNCTVMCKLCQVSHISQVAHNSADYFDKLFASTQ